MGLAEPAAGEAKTAQKTAAAQEGEAYYREAVALVFVMSQPAARPQAAGAGVGYAGAKGGNHLEGTGLREGERQHRSKRWLGRSKSDIKYNMN